MIYMNAIGESCYAKLLTLMITLVLIKQQQSPFPSDNDSYRWSAEKKPKSKNKKHKNKKSLWKSGWKDILLRKKTPVPTSRQNSGRT